MSGLRGIGGLAPAASAPLQPSSPPVKAVGTPNPESTSTSSNELGFLSGLAVAGANHREAAGADSDDGIITAEEISALDLDGVEWVVLSACDTGAGEVWPGEGVIGLQRAFRVAGAHTVIMSLWAADDEAARAFMEALYSARLNRTMSTPDAMHAATLEVLTTRRERHQSTHPFYWAGFVATGDWS
jgi:CHAT domain-containing protein